jgi:chromate reductase
MQILGIVGSLRKDSFNKFALTALLDFLPKDVNLKIKELKDIPLLDLEISYENFPKSVKNLEEDVRQADALIIATPEYNYSIPGILKNSIDWLSIIKDQPFQGKPCAILGASPGRLGTARAQYHLRQIGVFLNLHFLNKPEVMISEAHNKFDKNGVLIDEQTKKHLKLMLETLIEFSKQKNKNQ